jgi:hypothetical protein
MEFQILHPCKTTGTITCLCCLTLPMHYNFIFCSYCYFFSVVTRRLQARFSTLTC